MIDFIGDIHGHADALEALLQHLGYKKTSDYYTHPERKVLFVGDYIDRGPKIRKTLAIVRAMVESENAIALMGNHEYNALCFHYPNARGGHLRKHSIKNIIQHYETLSQFKEYHKEYEDYLEWFKTLPLYYETEQFRAVHACWEPDKIAYLKNTLVNDRLTDDLIVQSVNKDHPLFHSIEDTLKGKEIKLPYGVSFFDKDNFERSSIRIKWWEDPAAMTYKSISVTSLDIRPDQPLETSLTNTLSFYPPMEKHVFFGHYWLEGSPSLYRNNICCLDYSVAKKGKLVAYRFDGEDTLDNRKLIYLP